MTPLEKWTYLSDSKRTAEFNAAYRQHGKFKHMLPTEPTNPIPIFEWVKILAPFAIVLWLIADAFK